MALSPAQSRAARGLLDWSQTQLSGRANLSESTVRDFEKGRRVPSANNLAAIRASLEAAGVIFVEENGEGSGVRLKKSAPNGPKLAYSATRRRKDGNTVAEWLGVAEGDDGASDLLARHLKEKLDAKASGYSEEDRVVLLRPDGELVAEGTAGEVVRRMLVRQAEG